MIKFIKYLLVWYVIVYFIISFMIMNFNIFNWPYEVKLTHAVLGVATAILYVLDKKFNNN